MEIEMYVLGLPNFKDDRIVFKTEELDEIYGTIDRHIKRFSIPRKSKTKGGWRIYTLDPRKLNIMESKVYLVTMGYYHHRVIVYFHLEDDFYISERMRRISKRLMNEITNEYVKMKKNKFCNYEGAEKKMRQPINIMADKCLKRQIKKLKNSGNVRRIEKIKFYALKKVRKGLRSKWKQLVADIIDEQMKEKRNQILISEEIKKRLKQLVEEIINKHMRGKGHKILFSEDLRRKLKQLVDSTINELVEEKNYQIPGSDKIREILKKSVDGTIDELIEMKKDQILFSDEVRRRLKQLINEITNEYVKMKKIEFRNSEKIEEVFKQPINIMADKCLKRQIKKLRSFDIIGRREKIKFYILDGMRKILIYLIGILIRSCEILIQLIDDVTNSCKILIQSINDVIDSCVEEKMKELSVFEEIEREEDTFLLLRESRKELKKAADNMIDFFVKKQINQLIPGKVREEGNIKFIYTYSLIVVKNGAKRHEPMPFSEETTSLCFEVVEPTWWPPSGRRHLMRISIPSTILYVQKNVDRDLLRDIINAIYQHCLYEKKAIDNKKKLIDWKDGPFDNQLDETILVKLWTHILDTMGGERAEVRIARTTNWTRLIAFLALIFSALTLIHRIFSNKPIIP